MGRESRYLNCDGSALKRWMDAQGYTRKRLAGKSGLSVETIRIIYEKGLITDKSMDKLAAVGFDVNELFGARKRQKADPEEVKRQNNKGIEIDVNKLKAIQEEKRIRNADIGRASKRTVKAVESAKKNGRLSRAMVDALEEMGVPVESIAKDDAETADASETPLTRDDVEKIARQISLRYMTNFEVRLANVMYKFFGDEINNALRERRIWEE